MPVTMPVGFSNIPTPASKITVEVAACSSGEIKSLISSATLPFVCGAISGIAGAVVGQPFDTIKVRMQTNFKMPCGQIPSGAWQYFNMTIRHEGVIGLFKGMGPQLACQIVATSLLFGAQDRILGTLSCQLKRPKDDLLLISSAGAVSGGLLSLVTCPMELVKCGLQTHSGQAGAKPVSNLRLAVHVTKQIINKSGVRGLYTGLTLTTLRCSAGNFGFFGVHEMCWRMERAASANSEPKPSPWKYMLYGAISGAAYWVVCYPLDLMKRTQCNAVQGEAGALLPWRTHTSGAVSLSIIRQIFTMYKGLNVTLIRGLPVSSVGWLVFGTCKEMLSA